MSQNMPERKPFCINDLGICVIPKPVRSGRSPEANKVGNSSFIVLFGYPRKSIFVFVYASILFWISLPF